MIDAQLSLYSWRFFSKTKKKSNVQLHFLSSALKSTHVYRYPSIRSNHFSFKIFFFWIDLVFDRFLFHGLAILSETHCGFLSLGWCRKKKVLFLRYRHTTHIWSACWGLLQTDRYQMIVQFFWLVMRSHGMCRSISSEMYMVSFFFFLFCVST